MSHPLQVDVEGRMLATDREARERIAVLEDEVMELRAVVASAKKLEERMRWLEERYGDAVTKSAVMFQSAVMSKLDGATEIEIKHEYGRGDSWTRHTFDVSGRYRP